MTTQALEKLRADERERRSRQRTPRLTQEQSEAVQVRCARLVLKGRYGRACREWARAYGKGSPLMLATDADRIRWAEGILAKLALAPR